MGPDYNCLKRAASDCAARWDEKLLLPEQDPNISIVRRARARLTCAKAADPSRVRHNRRSNLQARSASWTPQTPSSSSPCPTGTLKSFHARRLRASKRSRPAWPPRWLPLQPLPCPALNGSTCSASCSPSSPTARARRRRGRTPPRAKYGTSSSRGRDRPWSPPHREGSGGSRRLLSPIAGPSRTQLHSRPLPPAVATHVAAAPAGGESLGQSARRRCRRSHRAHRGPPRRQRCGRVHRSCRHRRRR